MATEPTNGRTWWSAAVTVSRAGATAPRSMLRPARIVEGRRSSGAASTCWRRRAARPSSTRVGGSRGWPRACSRTGSRAGTQNALAGPLPESVSRSLVQHQVMERVARETLDDRQTAKLVETILSSPEFEAALHRVVSSPARARRHAAGADFGDAGHDQPQGLRRPGGRSAGARRRAGRHGRARRRPSLRRSCRGGVAFAIDTATVTAIFVIGSVLAGLARQWSRLPPAVAASRSPGPPRRCSTRLLRRVPASPARRREYGSCHVRVVGPAGTPPRFAARCCAYSAPWLAIVPLARHAAGAGRRPRRELQDFIASTTVVRDP